MMNNIKNFFIMLKNLFSKTMAIILLSTMCILHIMFVVMLFTAHSGATGLGIILFLWWFYIITFVD